MRRACAIALLCAGCVLDPTSQIDKSSLRVDVSGLPKGADLVVTATDSKGKPVERKNPLTGQTALEVVFVAGSLADGTVSVSGVVHDAAGKEIACGSAGGTVASGARIALSMASADDDANCGGCGNACSSGQHCSSGACVCDDTSCPDGCCAGASCVKLADQSTAHCGAIGTSCGSCTAPANATVQCLAATCSPYSCDVGFVDLDGMASNGCEYQCTRTGQENDEASCTDGVDNDCNGVKDCDEDACLMLLRSCSFMSCMGQQQFDCATKTWGACQANNSGENDVISCSDGVDNDCDGLTDCMDPGCQGLTQSCPFMSCTGTQTWDCASRTWGACSAPTTGENTVAACSDGIDNDCDGMTDCMDPDCQGLTQTCQYQTCSGSQTWNCSANTWSACTVDPSLEASIATCKDGIDNDCDGKTDCNDPGCQNIQEPCGSDICAAGLKLWVCLLDSFDLCLPYIPVSENSNATCDDNLDNNCNGKTDCMDTGCLGKKCATGKICCADGGCDTGC
jgi:hypothetical protein